MMKIIHEVGGNGNFMDPENVASIATQLIREGSRNDGRNR